MGNRTRGSLTRREREIMDVVYQRGRASAAEVLAGIPDPPGYSAVRALLRLLEDKGLLRHAQDGPRYVYSPTVPREKARRSALRDVLRTFFDDSTEDAVAALLDLDEPQLTPGQLDRIARLIEQAKREGR